jgi:hypothetical protein
MMWLLKPKPPRANRVCTYCGGCYGLARPRFPYCSPYCEAWAENEKLAPLVPGPHGDFIAALRYP